MNKASCRETWHGFKQAVNSKRIGIDKLNSNSIPELEWKMELKDLEQNELNCN